MGFLAISESEGTKNGARPVTDMLLDGTHIKVQRNRKAIREGDDRGDDRMGGNCVVTKHLWVTRNGAGFPNLSLVCDIVRF